MFKKTLKVIIILLLTLSLLGAANLYVGFELSSVDSLEMNVWTGFPLRHSKFAFEGFPLVEKISYDKPLESHPLNFIFDFIFWLIISYLIVYGTEKLIKKLLNFKK